MTTGSGEQQEDLAQPKLLPISVGAATRALQMVPGVGRGPEEWEGERGWAADYDQTFDLIVDLQVVLRGEQIHSDLGYYIEGFLSFYRALREEAEGRGTLPPSLSSPDWAESLRRDINADRELFGRLSNIFAKWGFIGLLLMFGQDNRVSIDEQAEALVTGPAAAANRQTLAQLKATLLMTAEQKTQLFSLAEEGMMLAAREHVLDEINPDQATAYLLGMADCWGVFDTHYERTEPEQPKA